MNGILNCGNRGPRFYDKSEFDAFRKASLAPFVPFAPEDFMFQLNPEEFANLKSQIVISSWGGVRRAAPYAFTEQGVSMLSSVLHSARAIQVNIETVRAFVRLRQMLASNAELWIKQLAIIRLGCKSPQPSRWLSRRLATLEKKYDIQFKAVFDAIRELMTPLEPRKKRSIGFTANIEGDVK